MRILIVHNHYGNFGVSGEAQDVVAEAELLSSHGHVVLKYEATNAEIEKMTLIYKCQALLQVMLDVRIVGLLPILAAMYQLFVWLSQTFRVANLRWRFRKSRCEIMAALVIVFMKTVNGPTFEGHSIYLFC